uniref:Uncharacterized protein n=1 Tax=Aegilops tauschii subsp. strangulata TaxID=200361 RepID=A0A453KLI1_AEGTS
MEQRRGGKPKVVFVLGATSTGKSKLAIALAARFGGEVINSDKIQVYAGLPVITNKVTDEECAGVPHHLLGCVPCPDADFTVDDFCREAADAIKRVLSNGGLPVVAGGSNRYVNALVEGDGGAFRSSHDCLFARAAFDPDASYTRGVRRAIGLPEMDAYLRRASDGDDDGAPAMLGRAVEDIKVNTFGLVLEQVEKIRRLSTLEGWDVRRVDCTEVLARMADGEGVQELWRKVVWEPVEDMVRTFVIAEKSSGKINLL